MVGLSASIIVSARKAILCGAQATGKFAKATIISSSLNIIARVISGAKGLAWLASNLWVLIVAFTLYLVGEYRKRRKIK